MNKLRTVALALALLASGAAHCADQRVYVLGESLDSGLGELPSTYTAKEFDRTAVRVQPIAGEKLDSGLGELPKGYTGQEFNRKTTRLNAVPGEKLDSGLSAAVSNEAVVVAGIAR